MLVDPNGVLCICDFGFSKIITRAGYWNSPVPRTRAVHRSVLGGETTDFPPATDHEMLSLTSERLKARSRETFLKREDLDGFRPRCQRDRSTAHRLSAVYRNRKVVMTFGPDGAGWWSGNGDHDHTRGRGCLL
ncbi:hypothetical protein B0H14DRAFT_2565830 [Mycena olivaceomarginata]|nr:hypothetical protein B0H14DRAFT_2565830 [Mycena olivaceomarginata]